MTEPSTDRLVVGLVRGLHGLRGAVRLEILTDASTRFAVGSVLYAEGDEAPLTVSWAQEDGPGILVRFREVPDRAVAESLRDRYLEAAAPAQALGPGEYYWHEVMGAAVSTTDGRDLGTVRDVFRAGGGEVYIVDGGAWGEVMVPAVGAVVREFAPAHGRIVVDAAGLDLDETPRVRRPRGRRTTRALSSGSSGGAETSGAPDVAPPDPA